MSQHSDRGSIEVFDASAYRVGIVCSQFNTDVTDKLLESALAECVKYKIADSEVSIHKVSGCVEIPLVLARMAQTKKFDCLIALGVVMRGETAHFDYVCDFVTQGILRVNLDEQIPIGFGVITCDTPEQAQARYSFGAHAVQAVLNSAKILKEYK